MKCALKKKLVPCKTCGKPTRSKIRRASCKICRRKQKAAYSLAYKTRAAILREARRAAMTEADRERERQYMRAYVDAHREQVRANQRRHMRREKKLNASVLVAFEALCLDCGAPHTQERRLAVLRRCSDFSVAEIREAYPCLWAGPAGERAIYRDRALLSEKQAEVAA